MCVCNAQATAKSSHVQSEELPVVITGNANNEYDNNTWVLNEWSLVDFARQIAAGMVSNRKQRQPSTLALCGHAVWSHVLADFQVVFC